MYNARHILSILLVISLLSGTTACSISDVNKQMMQFSQGRHYLPKPMRHQIFRNTPTARPLDSEQAYLQDKPLPETRYHGYGQPPGYAGVASRASLKEDSYGAGFEAGCDSYAAVMGAGTMRLIKPKFDVERLTKDQWYLRGFQDASAYCTHTLDWEIH